MGGLTGNDRKNSPSNQSAQTSTTVTKTDNRAVTGGVLADVSGAGAMVDITTTDQGAVAAGLQIALAGLDTALSENRVNAQVTQDAVSQAIGVASTVSQGQQNTTFKYVTWIILGVAAAAALYAYFSAKR